MAIEIKVYGKEPLDTLTETFANEDTLETGSLNAATAALAASLLCRAAKRTAPSERQEYIERNAEILRTYFLHLIDDDRKARLGYNKELKLGDPDRIEAAVHPAVTINEEIVSMCDQMLRLGLELKPLTDEENRHYLGEMADLALGAVKSAIRWILQLTSQCRDETYRYVVKRENELNLKELETLYGQY